MIEPSVVLNRPWLTFDLGSEMRVLSWAINRPGFSVARKIVWREVRNADLPLGFDVEAWFNDVLKERGDGDSIGLLTSRDVGRFKTSDVHLGQTRALIVATVGLSNAERVGERRQKTGHAVGTINVAARLETGTGEGLSDTGLLEAMSIAVQARTTAILDAGIPIGPHHATGTGTDCVVMASYPGKTDFAGLHSEVGEALGRGVYDAVLAGALDWKAEQEGLADARLR